MYILFFLVWIIFNGKFTLEIILSGLVISVFMYAFACKFMEWSPVKDRFFLRKSGQILRYLGLLIWEIVKANMATIHMIVSPVSHPHPVIVQFSTKLRSKTARVLLANSITLTPGTITVSLQDEKLTIHCLDKAFAKGLEDSSFERALLKLEEGRDS